eukprot:1648561-Pleurochrysis_carterae.AAC.2
MFGRSRRSARGRTRARAVRACTSTHENVHIYIHTRACAERERERRAQEAAPRREHLAGAVNGHALNACPRVYIDERRVARKYTKQTSARP